MFRLAHAGRLLGLLVIAAPAHAQLSPVVSPNPVTFGGFGDALAVVPDTDGGGTADLLVGASYEKPGGLNGTGRAYLLDGASGTVRLTFEGTVVQQRYGQVVAGLPDVTGDGRGDLVIYGGRFAEGGVAGVGRVEVRSGADGTLVRTLVSPTPQDNGGFGFAIAAVPDVDGDNFADIAVGAGRETAGGLTREGHVYLFSGASGALLRTVESPNGEASGDFGSAVAGLRDVTGDGRGDLLVGARSEDGGAASGGRAYVVSGSDGTVVRTLVSPSAELSALFGDRVAALGDVNGDGTPDVAVGTRYETAGGRAGAGNVHVFNGATGALLRTLTSPDAETNGWFGGAIASDGGTGLLVAATLQTSAGGPTADGVVYHMDAATGARLATITSPNAEAGGAFGNALAWLGSPVVSASSEDAGGILASGRVYGPFMPVAAEAAPDQAAVRLVVWPNPARSTATVRLTLDAPARLDVALVDALGRLVARLADGEHAAGDVTLHLPAGLAPGVYAVRAVVGGQPTSRMVTVVR